MRGKRIAFSAVYALFLVVTFLAGLELISRFVFHRYLQAQDPWTDFDPRVGYGALPGFDRQICHGEYAVTGGAASELAYDSLIGWRPRRSYSAERCFGVYPIPVPVRTNRDGFRDDDWDEKLRRAERSGAKKILLFGDSMVYGFASVEEDRLSEQMAAVYELNGQRVEVFNAGIPAAGPAQEYRLLPELLDRIGPDVVILIFVDNDYGDTALPYDHRLPLRVYKPFYDSTGRLVLNERVPRRPSARVDGTFLEKSGIWFAADVLYFFIQDLTYARHDIPSRRTSPYPIQWYDAFIYEEELKSRFPHVEATVLTLLDRMKELAESHGARFYAASSRERYEYVVKGKMAAHGIPFIPVPPEQAAYAGWEGILADRNHLNFLWSWIMANWLHSEVEGKEYVPGFEGMPQLASVPTSLNLGDDRASVRYLSGDWKPRDGAGRWLGGRAAFMLRNPAPGDAKPLFLDITAHGMGSDARFVLMDPRYEPICELDLPTSRTTITCPLGARSEELLLFEFFPDSAAFERKQREEGPDAYVWGFFEKLTVHD